MILVEPLPVVFRPLESLGNTSASRVLKANAGMKFRNYATATNSRSTDNDRHTSKNSAHSHPEM